jgi:hypothetical protein
MDMIYIKVVVNMKISTYTLLPLTWVNNVFLLIAKDLGYFYILCDKIMLRK